MNSKRETETQFLEDLQNLFLEKMEHQLKLVADRVDSETYYKIMMKEIEDSEKLLKEIKELLENYHLKVMKSVSLKKAA